MVSRWQRTGMIVISALKLRIDNSTKYLIININTVIDTADFNGFAIESTFPLKESTQFSAQLETCLV